MVNGGIALDAGLDFEASTDDRTSIKQQDGSSNLLPDHKIISEEELKCEAEKCLKVIQRKSSLSYHGFIYGETQFQEPSKVPLKRRQHSMLKFEKHNVLKQEINLRESVTTWNHEGVVLRKVQERLSEEFELLSRNINLQLNNFEKSLVKEMKDDLKYVLSLEDEFDDKNSFKNMPRFSSNDMVHNHYQEEAKKKTQERDRNSKTSVMPSARLQNTVNGSKPKPRSTNQMTHNWPTHKSSYVMKTDVPQAEHSRNSNSFSDSKRFVCLTCQKCVFNADHDACITKLLKEVNSWGKKQSHKTSNRYIPVEKKSNAKKPERRIFTGYKFSPIKSFAVYLKTTPPRFSFTWKPMGRIFAFVCHRWIPMGKTVETCLNINDSALPLGKETCSPNIVICANSSFLSAELRKSTTG
ncbi:hypothetical protein Tco_0024415 [Tanacetum coccineum]